MIRLIQKIWGETQMNKFIKIFLVLLLSGCATQSVYIKSYSGVTLQPSELALVKPAAYIIIDSIDDGSLVNINPSGGFSIKEIEIAFLPGEHVFIVSYFNGVSASTGSVRMNVSVEAGHKYLLMPMYNSNQTWKPVFTDVTERSECWTIKAGIWGGPKNCQM